MQLLLIVQSELCLLCTAEINFCINFELYDLPNGVTSKAQIWYTTFDSSKVQDHTVGCTKKMKRMDSYLNFSKGIVSGSFGFWSSKNTRNFRG